MVPLLFNWCTINSIISSVTLFFLTNPGYSAIDQCQADYDYVATENDELSIKVGDVVNIVLRHDDGWWRGELNGKTGLFPASYVHQL